MAYRLGIDTGGTYTDGVIWDDSEQTIITKAKALTTYGNLVEGITNCLQALNFDDWARIKGVALSTTLATNAIVEGRGCEVGLLLIGHPPIDVIPTPYVEVVTGGHDVQGDQLAELDTNGMNLALDRFNGKVEAVAISGYFSVRNPEHETIARDIVINKLGIPVVCGHQLTTALGFHERTVTAVLNAKLIPVIAELITSVKTVMISMGITAPLMLVKGNGTLMNEEAARKKPIDTILSGPAASVVGSTTLAGCSEAIVMDMGGTTTDIAILKNGKPRISPEGAMISNWLTRVEAAEIYTYGIGGDSYIHLNADKELAVGPQKVWPLSLVVKQYPYLQEEISEQAETKSCRTNFQPTDAFMLVKDNYSKCTAVEANIIKLLADGPHTFVYLARQLQDEGLQDFQLLATLGRLAGNDVLVKISLTPTDLLHVMGQYISWDTNAAKLGVAIMAKELGVGAKQFLKLAWDAIMENLYFAVIQSLLNYEGSSILLHKNKDIKYLFQKALHAGGDTLGLSARVHYPIIAIGAPAHAYLSQIAKKLDCELITPEDADVANAVGAVSGQVVEKLKIIVKSMPGNGATLHFPWERKTFSDYQLAKQLGIEQGRLHAKEMAEQSGATDIEIVMEVEDVYADSNKRLGDKILLETRITIIVLGRPKW
ncbi:hydantoinase/oxoprolinase family protein [Sporomusa malonica]|uniref:N-methylhydantoinase A/oxoprolinase/acetone carboxylase, beta subunit n=1 Tax=Sporomusa malonica TaxID=112901 RepID=A0A1W1ZBS6_9FIRM|nr:hydantoinase/oxoprolinase family protein [Sporomusa malonica]SMC45837.1 N-methylhydantoinase A/oxoprolinase/acetone carboxylase, beta subunit [Sporomusa malonica]